MGSATNTSPPLLRPLLLLVLALPYPLSSHTRWYDTGKAKGLGEQCRFDDDEEDGGYPRLNRRRPARAGGVHAAGLPRDAALAAGEGRHRRPRPPAREGGMPRRRAP